MNTRSMAGKLTDIQECFRNDVDFFCINESWLNDNFDDENVNWIGNKMFRLDRTANKSGGLVTYVNNSWACNTTVNNDLSFINDDIEVQTLIVNKEFRKKIMICNIYRPPGGNHVKFFETLTGIFVDIDVSDYDIWIGGDYNIDVKQVDETKCKALHTFASELNLKVLIDTCTRPVSGTAIDNILTNAENVVYNKPLPVFISDHLPVLAV